MSLLTPANSGAPVIPFTYEQEWYHANTRASTATHKNVALSYEILGAFDPSVFVRSVQFFVARHDALHMSLISAPGGAPAVHGQRIRPLGAAEQIILCQDVTASSAKQFSRYASALLSHDFVKPWPEGEDRPFTLRLLRYGDEHHAFLATFQNLFFDGRAHHVFAREIWRDYEALRRGEAVPRTAPSFAEAALRQRARSGPRHLARAKESWRNRLGFAVRNVWQRPERATPTGDGLVQADIVGGDVEALRKVCEQERCTVMQWLVGSFAQALAECAGMRRVGLWTSMDSRRSGERDVVGMFAGACPLAVREPGAGPHAVLAEVRGQMLEALRYQQLAAQELTDLAREFAAAGAAPLKRDLYVNLRTFDGRYRPSRQDGSLRVTADAYSMRNVVFTDSSALHLRCNEYQDRILIDLIFNGQRVGRPLAQAILNRMVRGAVTGPAPTTESRGSRT